MMTKVVDIPPAGQAQSKRNVRPRIPSRGRGVQRFAMLVDATEQLLQERSSDEVGLYQIAEQAGVPAASVYHFFPTKEAAFLALAQRYLEGFSGLGREYPATALESWQSLVAWEQGLGAEYYNAHPPALKIFLGGFGGEETSQASRMWNERSARWVLNRFQRLFVFPELLHGERMFHINIEILDAVWRVSYLQHGKITNDYVQEAFQASRAYLRLYLPEFIPLRPDYRDAVAQGKPVSMPPVTPDVEAETSAD